MTHSFRRFSTLMTGAALAIHLMGALSWLDRHLAVRVHGCTEHARTMKVESDLRTIHGAAVVLEAVKGRWPSAIDELINVVDSHGLPVPGTLERIPRDPWANWYSLERDAGGVRMACWGKDGKPGGDGADADRVYP